MWLFSAWLFNHLQNTKLFCYVLFYSRTSEKIKPLPTQWSGSRVQILVQDLAPADTQSSGNLSQRLSQTIIQACSDYKINARALGAALQHKLDWQTQTLHCTAGHKTGFWGLHKLFGYLNTHQLFNASQVKMTIVNFSDFGKALKCNCQFDRGDFAVWEAPA